jgi:hypothetical protein
VAVCSLVSALVHKFVAPSHRAAKATRRHCSPTPTS